MSMSSVDEGGLKPGTHLGSYEILNLLGAGGLGEVYLATDSKLGRRVAIKILHEEGRLDSDRLRRFAQEARAASALNHPNIVTIHDIGQEGSIHYIVMEYVEGKTLRYILGQGSPPIGEMLRIAVQITDGIAKAHDAGIVHRDLKPENLMVTEDGFVKILDFGLAKLTTQSTDDKSEAVTVSKITRTGIVMGTTGYMSPEQACGQRIDYRSDQFSLGIILYEMATGKHPFRRPSGAQTLAAILDCQPESAAALNPNLPSSFVMILRRCLAKAPEQRYDSTRDLARDLKAVAEGRDVPLDFRAGIESHAEIEPRARIESLAVLPLADLSHNPEQEYFVDGMTEALIGCLAKIRSLKVISRTSSMRYKGTSKPLPEIARELNVQAIIEGSILRAGDQVRINVQLIDAGTDQHIWAESYEGNLRNIFSLQNEVARAIAREIEISLSPREESLLAPVSSVNAEAHEAYLKGCHHLYKLTSRDEFDNAIRYFQIALNIDPEFAPAYAGLADAHLFYAFLGFRSPRKTLPKAKEAALRAIELDPNLAEAHLSLGLVLIFWDRDISGHEAEFKRAIELNPNLVTARTANAQRLACWGQYEDSIKENNVALALDPFSIEAHLAATMILFNARRFNAAIEQGEKTIEMEPNTPLVYYLLALVYRRKGMTQEAFDSWQRFLSLTGMPIRGLVQRAYKRSGLEAALTTIARFAAFGYYLYQIIRLIPFVKETYVPAFVVAVLYTEAGKSNVALPWLHRAYKEHDIQVITTNWPTWDKIRKDPGFQAFAKLPGLPPAPTSDSGSAGSGTSHTGRG